ncbi:LysR family transcriptional regulator [Leifsonia sp. ZF2019]|uniref:LysR family transcriptional regulator n=1 Tax=Leifsonia sp. ZF2019 TaxID=2781978 RepID=UPI001CC0AE05|nr:LysR family transcriptional regulator [Leifsonia sp. ZF2019]
MDLIAACRVLVEIGDRGSVTRAAAALEVAQSVASRRILALESHLGGALLERTARSAALTPFARDLLPSARRLVRLADELELDADRARLRPVTVAVPVGCAIRELAVAEAAGRAAGLRLEFRAETPARRTELAATRGVRLAIASVAADTASWVAELGVAGRRSSGTRLRLDELRPGRTGRRRDDDAGARLRFGPEDDVPHIRDALLRAAFAVGVLPAQLPVDASTTSSLASVLADGDLLLCTEAEARELDLHWRSFSGLRVARGYTLVGDSENDVATVLHAVADELVSALGARARADREPAAETLAARALSPGEARGA